MSVQAHIVEFLLALEARIAPVPGHRHLVFAARTGTEIKGYSERLYLQLASRQMLEPICIDDGDLARPVDDLVAEVVEIINAAAGLKRQPIGGSQ
jgi:hypothetical protein